MSDTILIVGPAWIGDMVMAQALCKSLQNQRPGCQIDMLAPGWSLPVVARMPEVRSGIEAPFAHGEFNWPARRALGRSLRQRCYTQAIVLPRSLKSALVPLHARIPVRTGYRGEMRYGLLNDIRTLDTRAAPRTVDRYLALGATVENGGPGSDPIPELRVDPANQQAALQRLKLDTANRVVGLMPGAEYGPAKQWSARRFGALAKTLGERGVAVWIFGSEKDREVADEVIAAGGVSARNLCGETSLTDAIDLVALCSDVVTNDSGLMHIAAATGVRVIAIYGSSSPNFTPPLTPRKEIVWLDIECSPCFDRHCRFGHYRCLEEISATRIAALLN